MKHFARPRGPVPDGGAGSGRCNHKASQFENRGRLTGRDIADGKRLASPCRRKEVGVRDVPDIARLSVPLARAY